MRIIISNDSVSRYSVYGYAKRPMHPVELWALYIIRQLRGKAKLYANQSIVSNLSRVTYHLFTNSGHGITSAYT